MAFDIAYHMSWPSSNDPYYLANPSENDARRSFYGVNATPTMKCDGAACGTSQTQIQAAINSRLLVSSHLWLDLEMTINGNYIDATCIAVSDANITGSKMLHMVLLERYKYLPSSPNGQPHHYHAMLDMAPSSSGQLYTATAGDTNYYYASFPINPSWSLDNLDVACFVQDNANRDVLQAHVEQVPVDFPGLYYVSHTLEDNGNNDGRPEPGETVELYMTMGNLEPFQPATNVVATLSTTDPDLIVTTATVNYPDIPNGGTGTNANPFVFEVNPAATPHPSSLHIDVVADPQQTSFGFDIDIYVGWPYVLLVDDDYMGIMEDYYQSTLQNIGVTYEDWQNYSQGAPTVEWLQHYPVVIWLTGWDIIDALTPTEQTVVEDFLNAGGCLFLCGQNIAQGLTVIAPTYLQDVLHATLTVPSTGIKLLDGITGNPVGDGLSVDCNPGGQGSGTCTSPDGITVLAPAEEAFIYQGSDSLGGLTYDHPSGGKLCFFAFPFEAVNGLGGTNTREEILEIILDYLIPGTTPNMIVNVTYQSGSPVPPSGGNIYYDIYVENASGTVLDFDGWVDIVYEGGAPNTVLIRSFTNYQPGWTINRSNVFYPVPGAWPGGNYELYARVGNHPATIWEEDSFAFVKSGDGDAGFDFSSALPISSYPNPFDEITKPEAGKGIAAEFPVLNAYPNPFNPTTTVSYTIDEASIVKLTIYDVTGRVVAELVDGFRDAGQHQASFDGTGLASGIYVYRLQAGSSTVSGKMVLMK